MENVSWRSLKLLAVGILALMIVGIFSVPSSAAEQEVQNVANAPFSWQGLYAGVHLGYGWGKADTEIIPTPTAQIFVNLEKQTLSNDTKGILGGLQLGYNYQMGIFVVGAETSFALTDMRGSDIVSPITQNNGTPFPGEGNCISTHQSTDWLGTLRLRLGVTPTPRLLLYTTGGVAAGHVQYQANTDFRPVGTEQYASSFSKTKMGITAGAGAEFAVTRNISIKAEYLYYDLGDESAVALPSIPFGSGAPPFGVIYKWKTAGSIVDVGLSYRF